MAVSGLGDITARIRAWPDLMRSVPAAWEPPGTDDFAEGVPVLAYDGSLSATGWACIARWGSLFVLHGHGTLRVVTELTGFRGTYDKAYRMSPLIENVYISQVTTRRDTITAWEAPPVIGHRTESTLIAGYLVYQACSGRGFAVAANHASKVLTGGPRHDKKEIAAAVARYVPEALNRNWSEHSRDALAIALTVLWDLRVARTS